MSTMKPSGQSGGWTAYTPTIGGVTLGNGTVVGFYRKVGKTLHLRVRFVAGSTTVVTGAMSVSLPTGLTSSALPNVGLVEIFIGAAIYSGVVDFGAAASVGNVYAPTSSANCSMVAADT